MQFNLEKKEKGVVEVKVVVDATEWNNALNSAYEKNKGTIDLLLSIRIMYAFFDNQQFLDI